MSVELWLAGFTVPACRQGAVGEGAQSCSPWTAPPGGVRQLGWPVCFASYGLFLGCAGPYSACSHSVRHMHPPRASWGAWLLVGISRVGRVPPESALCVSGSPARLLGVRYACSLARAISA